MAVSCIRSWVRTPRFTISVSEKEKKMIDSNYMSEFTFEKEWVERQGILLVLAFFLGGLGGGLYLVSAYFHFPVGIVTAFFIVAIGKGGCHMLYLGKPLRFWRAFLRPQTSWISRGIIAVVGFVLFVGLQLAPTIPGLSGLPWSADNIVLQTFAIISSIVLIAYTGFALGVINAIPIWNTALMPLLFILYALMGGTGLTLGIVAGTGNQSVDIETLEALARILMMIAAFTIGIYLWISYQVNPTAKYSVRQLIKGQAAPYFLGGVIILGLVVPFTVASLPAPPVVIAIASACELVGGFCLRYSILKAGVYAPIV